MRVLLLLAVVALPRLLWAASPTPSSGQSARVRELSELRQRIGRARGQIGRKRATERVLSTQIARYSRRLDRLEARISTLGERQAQIERELDDRREELDQLRTSHAHQARLGTALGASVRQGQVTGYVGNTGNSFGAHLHFEVRIDGTPADPMGYL